MASLITKYEPVQKRDRITGERTAASRVRPSVRKRMAANAARSRTERLVKMHGLEATRQQFLHDAAAVARGVRKLTDDIQKWADRGWLGDMRKTIEKRTAANQHHMAELIAAAEVLGWDLKQMHKARSPGMADGVT
jgi:hypothetical protein